MDVCCSSLASGAKHVVSIEGRENRVSDAVTFLDMHGQSGKYTANTGDMYDFLFNHGYNKDELHKQIK